MSRRDQAVRVEFQGKKGITDNGAVGAAPVIDVSADESQVITIGANTTIAAPTGTSSLQVGDLLFLVVKNTGVFTLAWNAAWRNAPAMAAGANNQRASFEFRWDGANMQFVGGSTAFA